MIDRDDYPGITDSDAFARYTEAAKDPKLVCQLADALVLIRKRVLTAERVTTADRELTAEREQDRRDIRKLIEIALRQGLPGDTFIKAWQTAQIERCKTATPIAYHAAHQMFGNDTPALVGHRGGAANPAGADSGFAVRLIAHHVADNIPNRYSLIAALAASAGISTTRQRVRGVLLRGRT